MPKNDPERRRELEGWKAIAEYLGVSVRTAQLYGANLNMPVRRLGPGPKARVWASADELDYWREHANPEEIRRHVNEAPPGTEPRASRRDGWRPYHPAVLAVAATVVLIAAAGASAAWWLGHRPGRMVRYDVRLNLLRAFDERDRILWEHTLPAVHFQELNPGHREGLIADIDGDGKDEFLFLFQPRGTSEAGSFTYCFRSDGTVAWTVRPGRL